MGLAARLAAASALFAAAAVAGYFLVDWAELLSRHPHYLRPLRNAVGTLLRAGGLWALAVPGLLAAVAFFRLVKAKDGRANVVWKLFAFLTLWGLLSFGFFFGLFLAYAPTLGEAGRGLLVPALAALVAYYLLGLAFLASMARKE